MQLARVSGAQPVSGQYLVGPDGTINLRQYGVVHVAGKTVTEARLAIAEAPQRSSSTRRSFPSRWSAYNSKVYYVITQGAGMGDNVRRLPVTGNETVLDAISNVNGLSQLSSTADLDCPAGAEPVRLPADPAGRLGCDRAGGRDGDQLPGAAGRPGVHRRGRDDHFNNMFAVGHRAAGAGGGHLGPEQLDDPRLPDDGPQLQPPAQRLLTQKRPASRAAKRALIAFRLSPSALLLYTEPEFAVDIV